MDSNVTTTATNNATPTSNEPDYQELFWFGNIIIIAICIVTLFGNLLTIAAFIKYKPLRRIGNYFLVSLAVADLGLGITNLLNMVDFGDCHPILEDLTYALGDALLLTSVLHLVLIAVDRYLLVMYPAQYGDKMTMKTVNIVIGLTWLFMALLFYLPMLKYAAVAYECEPLMSEVYATIVFVIGYLVTMPTITIIYIKIMVLARNKSHEIERAILVTAALGMPNTDHEDTGAGLTSMSDEDPANDATRIQKADTKEDKKSLIILLVLILATFILWTPYFVYALLELLNVVDPEEQARGELEYVLFIVGLANSAVNTFVYVSVSSEFRAAYGKLLVCASLRRLCCLEKRNPSLDLQSEPMEI